VEDIGNTNQRPKIEGFDGYYFIAAKMISYDDREARIKSEHISIVYGHGFVVLFLQDPGDLFAPIRQRIESGKGRIRSMGSDYLVYAVVDAVVDYYFHVIEEVGERIEQLEDEVVSNPTARTLRAIHHVKREMIALRRSIWPMREVVNTIRRSDTAELDGWYADLYDNVIRAGEWTESLRDMITTVFETNLSLQDARLNIVVKKLTGWAAIIAVPTLVTGWYGQNVPYPGFSQVSGVVTSALLSVIASVVLYVMFRRRGWI
jgi:magnesium transporter